MVYSIRIQLSVFTSLVGTIQDSSILNTFNAHLLRANEPSTSPREKVESIVKMNNDLDAMLEDFRLVLL